jgi:hypothetical protein
MTDDRTIVKRDGYVVVISENAKEPIPLDCPVCNLVMHDIADLVSYDEWKCCSWCERMWVQGKRDEWREGWRPERERVDATLRGLGMIG